jgi:hypothetical protein
VAGLGFGQDMAMVTFPIELFLADSNLAPLRLKLDEFFHGLTKWSPENAEIGLQFQPPITVEVGTQDQAFVEANNLILMNLWGDGLPILPPTRERVDWILQGSDLAPDHILGKFLPRGGVTNVETVATSLAMAGGRPEYLPVLIAAVQAIFDPRTLHDRLQSASGNAYPVVIVNGPIAKQVRLSADYGCLGPDPQRPAGTSIGRALRLLQQNVGGALPGVGSVGVYGGMRTTNAVFAEDEDGLPENWLPHSADRHKFSAGQNSVSVVFASGMTNIKRRATGEITAEDEALESLYRTAGYLRTPNLHYLNGYDDGTPGILMLTRTTAMLLAQSGWNKDKIRKFLWENSQIPHEEIDRTGSFRWIRADPSKIVRDSEKLEMWPINSKAENLIIVVAGGAHPTNSYWLQGYCPYVSGKEITVSADFDRLLKESERDIGCGSEVCLI